MCIRDRGNTQAITFYDEHIFLGMWGGDWNFLAAENINGVNSVIWRFTDRYNGQDSYWLSEHDDQWAYTNSGDAGWQGDPRYGEAPDQQFYLTETNFNIDLNGDGRIGAPPNNAPVLTGQQYTFPTLEVGQEFIICLLYTSPSPRDMRRSRMPSSA